MMTKFLAGVFVGCLLMYWFSECECPSTLATKQVIYSHAQPRVALMIAAKNGCERQPQSD
ncbi:hypothetical protein [Shewanella ulleungensis]|uniref:hypothetical protein n=1 Tax=Shewanella ulleungensis TaxID=2282699 RepID=UPI003D794DC2